jgi:choline dehydrogenase
MKTDDTFDYVVVGGGSAGCVVARRLLDALDCRVLLLEAGGDGDRPDLRATDVPTVTGLWGRPDSVWPYHTEPQPGLDGRTVDLPQGRVLGGGSAVNALMYVRGNPADFNHWASRGNRGWAYADVLPYFRRAERYHGPVGPHRGTGGPLDVIDYAEPSEASRSFHAAAAGLGFASDGDYNGSDPEDRVFYYQSTRTPENVRSSTASAYIGPVRDNPRLTVLDRSHVLELLFDGDRAAGVRYVRDGAARTAGATTEVLLAAGAIGTPALLLRSGIGAAGAVSVPGTAPRVELPGVGADLQDHLLFGVAYESLRPLPFPRLLAEAGLFTRTRPDTPTGAPDLQFFFGPVQFVDEQYRTDGPGFTFAPILAQPLSRGTVRLRPGDPYGLPVVDPRYLSDPVDAQVLVRGIELARELARSAPFAPLRGRELAPGEKVDDRPDLLRYVRANASTVWHPAGTARMGVDRGAVVDPELRVYGVDGLRVVDASVMPTITAGNTNAATVMIGEKASDLVIKSVSSSVTSNGAGS